MEVDMRDWRGVFLCLALAACKKDSSGDDSSGTGADDSAADDSASNDDSGTACTLSVVATSPVKGGGPWLYTDPLRVTFDEPGEAATFEIVDADGNPVAFTSTWDKGSDAVSLDAELTGSTTYTLTVTACGVATTVDFTTSEYGSPLTIDPATLVGNTYLFDLATAEYSQPPGIGSLVALYVSAQVLIGITGVDAPTVGLIGGQGVLDNGMFVQDDVPTFEFDADFTASPFFSGSSPLVQIVVDNTYTLYDFAVEGTFAPDGTSIGGARVSMQVDTTNLGDAMNLPDADDPMAVCNFIEDLGIPCETCSGTGKDNCIAIVANWDEAMLVPGLTLVQIDPPKKK
jgi:hypothetical protein